MIWQFIQQNLHWVGLALVSGGILIWPFLKGASGSISPAQATLLVNREDALMLDVRETGEWAAGHIPNARHISMAQLEKRISELDKFKSRPIIAYCASGSRSSSACAVLKRAGFEKVYNLAGGIGAWTEASLPVTAK